MKTIDMKQVIAWAVVIVVFGTLLIVSRAAELHLNMH